PSTENESDIEMDELLIEKETNFLEDSSVAIMSDSNIQSSSINASIDVYPSSIESEDSTSILVSQINALIADSDRVEMNTANFIPISPSQEQALTEGIVESKSAEIGAELNNEQESDPVDGKTEILASDTRACIDRLSNFSTHPNSPNLNNIPYSTLLMDSP
ncbi:3345_t:CDS:1, partial [Ambispora gerdemannii]